MLYTDFEKLTKVDSNGKEYHTEAFYVDIAIELINERGQIKTSDIIHHLDNSNFDFLEGDLFVTQNDRVRKRYIVDNLVSHRTLSGLVEYELVGDNVFMVGKNITAEQLEEFKEQSTRYHKQGKHIAGTKGFAGITKAMLAYEKKVKKRARDMLRSYKMTDVQSIEMAELCISGQLAEAKKYAKDNGIVKIPKRKPPKKGLTAAQMRHRI